MDNVFRIVGIDPGVTTLGFAVIDVDLNTNIPTVVYAGTVDGKEWVKKHAYLVEAHGERYSKVYGHMVNLTRLFNAWKPHSLSVESPFLGRFVQAYEALTECVIAIRMAIIEYDPNLKVHRVDPPSVKNAVGVKGKSKDKELVREGLRALGAALPFSDDVNLDELDEHSCDAIAVAYSRYKDCFGDLDGQGINTP